MKQISNKLKKTSLPGTNLKAEKKHETEKEKKLTGELIVGLQ